MKLKQNLGPSLAHNAMERALVVKPEELLPFIAQDKSCANAKRMYDQYRVNMWSLRFHTFKKSIRCRNCGIEGKFFALERPVNHTEEQYHFNMYAVLENGQELLMTKDHIVPKSKGGKDHIDNMQTMCKVCNELKSNRNDLIPEK